ncbi:uncharacterized protein [Musca autumnalis]|uniref:uncharacterized protein n=1 Tax=Musca autumnalis TaxID=221902 RepID=UPI003CF22744
MAQKCVMGCKDFKELFHFPAKESEKRLWCKFLEIPSVSNDARLCDLHFDPKYKTLKKTLRDVVEKSKKVNELRSPVKLELVKTTFETPPKRTYGQKNSSAAKPKPPPQLDITMTCYCRCHNREQEEREELQKTVEELKMKNKHQFDEIQTLMSQNKISEHLLKTKTKRIAELVSTEKYLRKQLESLQTVLSEQSRRHIIAAQNASENSITFARMACVKRKMYTKNEVLLAQKIYSISSGCYRFMRSVLHLNLPHPSTLKRQRELNTARNELNNTIDDGDDNVELDMESNGDNEEEEDDADHNTNLDPTECLSDIALI